MQGDDKLRYFFFQVISDTKTSLVLYLVGRYTDSRNSMTLLYDGKQEGIVITRTYIYYIR